MSTNKKIIFFSVLLILATVSRLLFLDTRPVHHDEGNNFFFAEKIVHEEAFTYDPENFHGPTYFFLLAASFATFGVTDFSLRLPAALFGVLLIIISFFLINKEKNLRYLVPIFLLAAPSFLYYSRYSIHESMFVFFEIVSLYVLSRMIEIKNIKLLPYLAIFFALLLATKETSVIALIIFLILIVPHFKKFAHLSWRQNIMILAASLYLFLLLYAAFFSSFFTNIAGIADSIRGFAPWLERARSEPTHMKPWFYYGGLLLSYELPLVLLGIYGSIMGFIKKNLLIRHFAFFTFALFCAYSALPYKTPWLIINFTVPLCLLSAYGVTQIPEKKIRTTVLVFSLAALGFFSYMLNVAYPWQDVNWYAYGHTDKNILGMVERIHAFPRDKKIAVISSAYWPLPYYLHDYSTDYFGQETKFHFEYFQTYPMLIINESLFREDEVPEGYEWERYHLRGAEYLYLISPQKKADSY